MEEKEGINRDSSKSEEKIWTRIGISKHVSAAVSAFLVIAAAMLFWFFLSKIMFFFNIVVTLLNAATPVIYGIVIAYILKPVYNRVQLGIEKFFRKRMKKHPDKADGISKAIASITVVLLLVLVFVLVFALLLPELYSSLMGLSEDLPTYVENGRDWIHNMFRKSPNLEANILSYYDNITSMTSEYVSEIFPEVNSLLGTVTSGIGNIMGFVYNIFIGLIVAIYLLIEKDTLTGQLRKLGYSIVKEKHVGIFREELRYADKMFSGYVFARFVDSILLGVIYGILGIMFEIPYVGMISVVVGITNMIPFFGPYIGALPCFIILLLASPVDALKFIVIDMIIMQVDANVISPKIIGNTTGLSGFWVLFSILFFGGLWGFVGMLIGVPLFAVLYHLAGSLLDRRLKKKSLPTDLNNYIREPVIERKDSKYREMLKKRGTKNDKDKKDKSGDE